MEHRKQPDHLVGAARSLRKRMSKPEVILWMKLRPKASGLPIRRQVPLLGKYIVDFAYQPKKLVFEIDGRHHDFRGEADEERDRVLAADGWTVCRIPAKSVLSDLDSAVESILLLCRGDLE